MKFEQRNVTIARNCSGKGPLRHVVVRGLAICFGLWFTSGYAAAAEIRFERRNSKLFLNAADVAEQLKLKLEIIRPHKLVTYCSTGEDAICIPVRLTGENHSGEADGLMLTESLVERSLGVAVEIIGNNIKITRSIDQRDQYAEIPAYNANWGEGRGFRPGQTVPDIPFIDLEGNEVRLSKFLGRKYILYCWASW